MTTPYAKAHFSAKAHAKQLKNSAHASTRWYNRPSFAKAMELLVEKAPHPHSQKSQEEARKSQQGEAKQSSGRDVLGFISDLRNSSQLMRAFLDVYSLVKRTWWGDETEEKENWHALLNGATEHMGWAGVWLGNRGLLHGAAKNYFETHELVGYNMMASAIKRAFEGATSPITCAFAVHWLESHGAVRKIQIEVHAEAPVAAPKVMGEMHAQKATGVNLSVQKATVEDLQGFALDWVAMGEELGTLILAMKHENCLWVNAVERTMNELVRKNPSNPATLQEYLGRLDEEGLLSSPAGFDFGMCRKVAHGKFGNAFAGALGAAQSQITKNFVWKIFRNLGYIAQEKEQRHDGGMLEYRRGIVTALLETEKCGFLPKALLYEFLRTNDGSHLNWIDVQNTYDSMKGAGRGNL